MILCFNDHIQELGDDVLQRAIDSLPSWRRERALAYKHKAGQLQCALAYVELCRALALMQKGSIDQPCFEYNEYGKPSLRDYPHLHFSMSHCSQAVGCVMDSKPCGLDIERIRPLKPALLQRVMNRKEQEQILAAQVPDMEFVKLWTRKEAMFKLLGTGITDSLPDILGVARERNIILTTHCNPARGYVLSIARETE